MHQLLLFSVSGDKMVMHGQVTDFMDVLLGKTPDTLAGEINFVMPSQREFDQELELVDLTDLLRQNSDEMSLIPDLDLLGEYLYETVLHHSVKCHRCEKHVNNVIKTF